MKQIIFDFEAYEDVMEIGNVKEVDKIGIVEEGLIYKGTL